MSPSSAAPSGEYAPETPPPVRGGFVGHYGPGLAAVAGGVVLSYLANRAVPALSALTIAVILGAVSRNTGLLGARILAGANLATKKLLRAGVVLLGLQLAIGQVMSLGVRQIIVVVTTVAITFAGTVGAGRLLGVRRGTAVLVATGFSICGASAAVAANEIRDDTDDNDLATAIALVTIYGGLAIFALPPLQQVLGLSDAAFGVWAGASVHEVAQVVATASAAGSSALAVAAIVKLTRVVLLAPLIAGMSIVRRRSAGADPRGKRPPVVPLFVVGFLVMMTIRSLGVLPEPVLAGAHTLTTLLLAGALFGLGTSVHLPTLVRTGARPVALGALSTLIAAGVALLGVTLIG